MKKLMAMLLLICVLTTSVACGSSVNYSITMSDYVVEMQVGETHELEVDSFKVGGENGDLSKLTFAVENENVASLSGTTLTAKSVGETKVTVSYEDVTASVTVVVLGDVYKISLSTDNVYVVKGKEVSLPTATITKNGVVVEDSVGFTVKDSTIATIANGKITGVKAGSTIITATYQNASVSFNLNVFKENIEFKCETEIGLPVGGNAHNLNVKSFTVDGEVKPIGLITYKSSNEQVVRVENGSLVGVGKGQTTVKAYYGGKEIQTIAVSVFNKASDSDVANFTGDIMTFGRSYRDSANNIVFDNVNGGLDFWFYGSECKIIVDVDGVENPSQKINKYVWITAYLDGQIQEGFINEKLPDYDHENQQGIVYDNQGLFLEGKHMPIDLDAGKNQEFTVFSGLENGLHHVRILKASEQNYGDWFSLRIKKIVESDKCEVVENLTPQKKFKMDVFGDSITCGAGIYGQQTDNISSLNGDGTRTYAAITARALNADIDVFSQSGLAVGAVMNGVPAWCSLETMWNKYSEVNQTVCAIDETTELVVINLGTNDAGALADTIGDPDNYGRLNKDFYNDTNDIYNARETGGIYTASEMKADITSTLTALRVAYPNAKFVWMYGMMNITPEVQTIITEALSELGGEAAGYYYLPIPAGHADVYGGATHPTLVGHVKSAKYLINFLFDKGIAQGLI